MPRKTRNKNNNKYFEIIEKKEVTIEEQVIKMIRKKYGLKQIRTGLNEKIRFIRKKAYNISLEINKLEFGIDSYVMNKCNKVK